MLMFEENRPLKHPLGGIMLDKPQKSPLSHELGEDRPIARRDFIQGALVASAVALTAMGYIAHAQSRSRA